MEGRVIKVENERIKELKDKLPAAKEEIENLLDEYSEALALYPEMEESEKQELYSKLLIDISLLEDTSELLSETKKASRSSASELNARLKDVDKATIISPSNTQIDENEEKTHHFAEGINIYKLLIILFVGSFLGVVMENIFFFLTTGNYESRAGLVYGPFNLLYGAGAVALTLMLYHFRNKSFLYSFIGGFIGGSVVEYLCSWGQEIVFGSTSWDYSHLPFNLNGRICLYFSFFWGILGVLWIKKLYPLISSAALKIPNKPGRIITLILTVFLAINGIITAAAVTRWDSRIDGEEPKTIVGKTLDERFPDDRMRKIFPNMNFGE